MADGAGRWQRVGVIPASRKPPESRTDPVYESLIRMWREQGRTIPGLPDHEWNRLIEQDPWPRY
ncbi:hypothetical protein CP970_28230 [Streptomyces kanamyceticus]|uniref:Uncharacterized protein n=1 Tax=Streptomyces kanamyceticus TaxID=1967 RepID=A0A5J6GML7_STRKN|nr:hypothetical protein CP970_28230 [Streptomyces kanamyceticus]